MDQRFDLGTVDAEILEGAVVERSKLANSQSALTPDGIGARPTAYSHDGPGGERFGKSSAGDGGVAAERSEIIHAIG
jgi:hypothetical protein